MTRTPLRLLVAVMFALLACGGVTACQPEDKTAVSEYACELAAPAIKLIALALKIDPETAVASIGLDALGITISAGCKRALATDTTPTTTEQFLRTDPNVPRQVQLQIPPDGTICSQAPGQFGSVISGDVNKSGPTPITTCPFSDHVRDALVASGGQTPVDVIAYSPAMSRDYNMHCEGEYPVICRGGDHALVLIY